jgi:hypothetical protein
MKVAVLIRGISYNKFYLHHSGKVYRLDYRGNRQNIIQQVIEPLKQHYNDVDVYLCTNSSEIEDSVVNDFGPIKGCIFVDSNATQVQTLCKGLEILDDGYDLIIITRFDIKLKTSIDMVPFKHEKFNLTWYEQTKDGRVGDCVFVLSSKHVGAFLKALNECPIKSNMHFIKPYLEKHMTSDQIHIMFDGYIDSNSDKQDNDLYTIARGELLGDMSKSKYIKYLGGKNFNCLGFL